MSAVKGVSFAVTGLALAGLVACGGMEGTGTGGGGGGGTGGGVAAGGGTGGGVATGGGTGGGSAADAGQGGGTGGGGMMVMAQYPSWMLQDVQPMSPRFNETYGLASFSGRPVVVVLLEGF